MRISALISLLSVITAVSVVPDPVLAQDEEPRSRLAILPIVFSSPETRLALGVLPQYLFHTSPDARPSNLRADLYYTWRKQFNIVLKPAVWTAGDAWQFSGVFRFRKWPTAYFGIGPDVVQRDEDQFTERLAHGSVEAMRLVRPGVYVGPSYAIRWADITDAEAGGILDSDGVPGTGSSRVAGLGLVATLDTREHVYLPEAGALYRLHAEWYAGHFGGDRDFGMFTADFRQYLKVARAVTAAFQASLSITSGDVPFRLMPNVGEIIRGYDRTWHIGRQRWAVQAEIRAIPLVWRFGLAVFGGVGSVSSTAGDFGVSDLDYAVGVGVRFLMFPRERITIREDFAFGRGSSGDYLDINEAF